MKQNVSAVIVLVTAPDLKTAQGLAKTILDQKLAACVNLVPGVESHYWWQGKIESSAEVFMIIKTTQRRLGKLEKVVRQNHPYEVPEFLVLRPSAGGADYLSWISKSI